MSYNIYKGKLVRVHKGVQLGDLLIERGNYEDSSMLMTNVIVGQETESQRLYCSCLLPPEPHKSTIRWIRAYNVEDDYSLYHTFCANPECVEAVRCDIDIIYMSKDHE